MFYALFLIPILGAIKNAVKYKQISPMLFMRTPIIYFIIYSYLYLNHYNSKSCKICLTIINERIFMFIYKIVYSLLTDSYHKNKLKYIKKYNILYNSRECLEDLKD